MRSTNHTLRGQKRRFWSVPRLYLALFALLGSESLGPYIRTATLAADLCYTPGGEATMPADVSETAPKDPDKPVGKRGVNGQFIVGQPSGNPKGRPKGKTISEYYRAISDEHITVDGKSMPMVEAVIRRSLGILISPDTTPKEFRALAVEFFNRHSGTSIPAMPDEDDVTNAEVLQQFKTIHESMRREMNKDADTGTEAG